MSKIQKRALIMVVCCLVVYVLAFVVLTRVSLRILTSCSVASGEYTAAETYYYVPYNSLEIASDENDRLETLHRLLVFIFVPLEKLDYRLTGYCSNHGTPTIGWEEVPREAVKRHPLYNMSAKESP